MKISLSSESRELGVGYTYGRIEEASRHSIEDPHVDSEGRAERRGNVEELCYGRRRNV